MTRSGEGLGAQTADGLAWPLPAPRRLELAAGEGAFVGRAVELEAVAAALTAARPGAPTVVTLAGDPGMGKTRLAAEAALRARAAGCSVLYGRSEPALELPYQPFADMLELAPLAPMLAERMPARICSLLVAASARGPLLLVLDDLHWADRATLALIGHVLASAHAPHAAVLLAFRADELRDRDTLTAVLSESDRRRRLTRLSLGGLSRPELVRLAADRTGQLGAPRDGSFEEALEGCAGNPFFAIELLRAGAETGVPAGLVPASVREVIHARVARLGTPAPGLLAVAAVAGREIDLALLERVAGQPPDLVADVLDRAQAAGLVEWVAAHATRVGFTHALIAKSLYEELGPVRRARLHRRLAEGLEELWEGRENAPLGELAHHWQEASPPDLARAAHYADRAEHAATHREPEAAPALDRALVAALTPRELEVAWLAAQGMRNREIAAALFLTVKTVEWHLANVFGKLALSSRRELSVALAGAGAANECGAG